MGARLSGIHFRQLMAMATIVGTIASCAFAAAPASAAPNVRATTSASTRHPVRDQSPGATISGTVTSVSGFAISGAALRITSLATGHTSHVTTAASGSYQVVVPHLPSKSDDPRYEVDVLGQGFFDQRQLVRTHGARPITFSPVLTPDAGTVTGAIQTAAGDPISGAVVSLVGFATGASESTISGSDGTFSLVTPALPTAAASDEIRLSVQSNGYLASQQLLMAPSGQATTANVVLDPSGGSGGQTAAQPNRLLATPSVTPTTVPSCPNGADVWNDNASDGQWETPGNWSNGLPGSSTYVCIPSGVTGTVTLSGTVRIEGLLLQTGQTLTVASGGLTISGGTVPSALEGTTTIDTSTSLTVASGNTLLNAAGSLVTVSGSTDVQGTFEQDAGVVATGAGDNPVDLENGSSMVFAGTGAGAFLVQDLTDESPTVTLSGNLSTGQSFTADAEELCSVGTPGTTTVHAQGTFVNGGTIATGHAGTCGFGSVSFTLPSGDGLTNNGTIDLAGQLNASATDTVTFNGLLTNSGTINVGVAGQPASNLVMPAGDTLTNDGSIAILDAAASSNDAASSIGISGPVSGPSPIAAADLVNAAGGTVTIGGSLGVQGIFTQDAGVVETAAGDQPVDLQNGSSLAFGGSGAGAFVVDDALNESPTVSLTGNLASGQTLTVDAEEFCAAAAGGTTTINAAGSFVNAGTITTSQSGNCGNGSVQLNLPSGDTLSNSGTLTLAGAPDGPTANAQTISGNLTNTGTVNVGLLGHPSGHLVLSSGDALINEGQLHVLNSASSSDLNPSTVLVAAGANFTNGAGGVITIAGTFLVQGKFTQDAGVISVGGTDQPVAFANGSKAVFNGTGAGSFVVDDPADVSPTVSLSGNLSSGQLLTIDGEDSCSGGTTTVNAAKSFTNGGTIATSHAGGCGNGAIVLTLPAGDTLTNTGTLSIAGSPDDEAADVETFDGDVTNAGTIHVGVGAQPAADMVMSSGNTLLNEGQINVLAAGLSSNTDTSTLALSTGAALVNGAGGTVANQGALSVHGTFTQDAGQVLTGADDNPVDLDNGSDLVFGGTGAGDFVVDDPTVGSPTVDLSGNLVSGQSFTADAEDLCQNSGVGTTTVHVAGSFTNAGTITTSLAGGCAQGNVTFTLPSGGTLTNSGTFLINGAPSSLNPNAQTFIGSIVNTGNLTVADNAHADITGSLSESGGAVLGALVVGQPASPMMLTVGGSLSLNGTLHFATATGASFFNGDAYDLYTGGSVSGSFTGATGLSAGGELAYDPALVTDGLNFTVVSLATYPLVTDVSPSSGPAGTTVSVFGTSFTQASAVHFGSVAGTNINVISADELTVVVPTGTGTVPVVVTTPNGTTSSLGTQRFTYASVSTGSTGSASLTVNVVDSVGTPLVGVVVGLADAASDNPVGAVETGADGSGSLTSLSTGETIEATLDTSIAPYGPTTSTVTLAAGANTVTLTSYIEPLVSSDPTSQTPGGDQEAVWPGILPQPGTTITGGPLTSTSDLAAVQFTLDYSTGSQVILSGDPAGTQPFCVDGNWSLTLIGPSPDTTSFSTSGSGCPPTSGPINIGTTLGLASGTYGGNFTESAPSGATKDGTSDVYLLPVPGTLSNLAPAPGALNAAAVLGGSTSIVVGDSGTLNATLGGLPLPGPVGYHSTFSFDSGGLTVNGDSFPAGWNGDTRDNFDNGAGSFEEGTASVPSAIGSTVLSFNVTCNEPGTWPITFSGDYWLPGSSAGYADALEGAPTVECTAPPASSTPTATGVHLDPATGNVSVTVAGKGLSAATSAVLLTSAGAVAASSTSVIAASTVVTAAFGVATPGLYNLEVLNGGTVISTTTGTPFEVSPALPLFSTQSIDSEGDVPGIATTHLYRITNEGTANGVAVLAFTFPSYLTAEPILDVAASPVGTELLLHGATGDDWTEYVAVPMNAGASSDISWTITLPPNAVFGSSPSVSLGEAVPIVANLAGQYTAAQWTTVSSETPTAIVDGAMGAGMNGYSAAMFAISALPLATATSYTANLNDRDLADAIDYLNTAIYDADAGSVDQSGGNTGTAPAPTPPAGMPTPPAPTQTPPSSFDGGDQAAASFGSYTFNTSEAEGADEGVSSGVSTSDNANADEITAPGSSTPTSAVVVGESTAYDDGTVTPVGIIPLKGSGSTTQSISLDSTWDAASQSTSLSSWTDGITDTVPVNDDGTTVPMAALPYLSSDNGPSFQDVSRAAVARAISHGQAVCTCTTLAGTQGSLSTVSADVFTGVAIGPGLLPHGGGGGSMQTVTTNNQTGSGFYQLESAFNAASGFLPSPLGAVLDLAAGVLALAAGGGLLVSLGAIILAWCLGGACQAMWDGSHALASEDPNNISVDPVGSGTAGWVTNRPLTYMITFQNEPSATAAAQNVTVTAKLDPNLDPSTVNFGDSSFSGTEPSYDPVSGMLTWEMPGIDLPPDTSPPGGEGYVSFSADPLPGVAQGTAISESAQVIFDFNPPIDTPTVTNKVDVTPPVATLSALPADEPAGNVSINWSTTSPVGVSQYILLQSEDGGPLEPVAATSNTEATVAVDTGHRYGYAIEVASDNAGLAGVVPTSAQATFQVVDGPGPYTSLNPTRICDTRAGNPSHLNSAPANQCNGGVGNPGSPISAQGIKTISVAGELGVPADATAVVLNVTVVNPAGSGYVTAFPAGGTAPTASNINFVPGAVEPNLVEVGIGTAGDVSFFSSARTDLVVDVEGYVAPTTPAGTGAGLYNPISVPTRICDTRIGNPSRLAGGAAQCNGGPSNPGERIANGGGTITVQVTGNGGVPSGATAAVLNVTDVAPSTSGFATVYPQGSGQPTASNLNYATGETTANRVIVPLSTSGQISVFSSAGSDIVVDVSGYYSAEGGSGTTFNPESTPVRICDTRPSNPSGLSGPQAQCNGKTIGSGQTLTVNVTGLAGVPANAKAVVINLTGVHPSAQTFLTVFPSAPAPTVSDLNPATGVVRANLSVATLNSNGRIFILNHTGSIDVVVDVLGWYS